MFRPSLRPRSFGQRTAFALAVAVSVLSPLPNSAFAFDNDGNEALIGTFELQPAAGEPPDARLNDRRWPATRPPVNRRPAGEARIETLFHDALDDLAAGEHASAQRLFEQLIAEAPESDYAARARRELAELYGAPGISRAATPVPVRLPPAVRDNRDSPPNVIAKPAPSSRWVSPETEMQFILDAGDRVFFSAGTADLGARARSVLAAQARWLNQHPDVDIAIEGHADDLPLSDDQEATLATARAEAVRSRLIAEGVEEARISTKSFGRAQRLSYCEQPECTAQNRRVVTLLSDRGPQRESAGFDARRDTLPVASGNPGIRAR